MTTTTTPPIFIHPHDLSSLLASSSPLSTSTSTTKPTTTIIDTRPPESYHASHIPGAVSLPEIFTYLAASTDAAGREATRAYFRELFSERAGLEFFDTGNKNKKEGGMVVFYEEEALSGFGRACRGYLILRWLGWPAGKLRVLEGGFERWGEEEGEKSSMRNGHGHGRWRGGGGGGGERRRNLAVNGGKGLKGEEEGEGEGERGEKNEEEELGERGGEEEEEEDLFVGVEEMLKVVEEEEKTKSSGGDKKVILIDTRDPEEWECTSSSPYGVDFCPRKGRIPGAVWIGWREMLDQTSAETGRGVRMKSKDEILTVCQRAGVHKEDGKEIILYCFKGARASLSFVALKEAGFRNVRLYLGSWNEWSRDLGLPICGVEG